MKDRRQYTCTHSIPLSSTCLLPEDSVSFRSSITAEGNAPRLANTLDLSSLSPAFYLPKEIE
jgi:hypothetical protein